MTRCNEKGPLSRMLSELSSARARDTSPHDQTENLTVSRAERQITGSMSGKIILRLLRESPSYSYVFAPGKQKNQK